MANYIESNQVALAPYTPSLDISLLDRTLRTKQMQYDTNTQRIQSSLDAQSNLDIANPYQKDYLNTKIKDVTSQLNKSAGSDFSSNAIVNSAIATSSQVSRDPIVQNGIISTQKIRMNMSDQKRLEKEGKYDEVSRFNDNEEINRYINSTDLKDSYRGRTSATEAFDAEKALNDAIQAKNPDVEVKINNLGQVERVTDKSKTRTPDQIRNIIESEMQVNPKIRERLAMVGKYNYKDYNSYNLSRAVNIQSNRISGTYDSMIDAVKKKITTNNDESLPYVKLIAQLENEKSRWTGYKNSETGEYNPGYYDNISNDIQSGNLNRAKETLQSQSTLINMVQKHTVNDHDISISVNEGAKMAIEQKDKDRLYELAVAKFNEDKSNNAFDRAMKRFDRGLKSDLGDPTQNLDLVNTNSPTGSSYTWENHNQKINDAETAEKSAVLTLRNAWEKENANLIQTYTKGETNPAIINGIKDNLFNRYKNENDKNWDNNDVTNKTYQKWRSGIAEPIIQQKNHLQEIKDKVQNDATTTYPMQGSVKVPELGLDIPLNSPLTSAIADINGKIEAIAQNANTQNPGKEGDRTQQYRNVLGPQVLHQEMLKYQNNPQIYNALAAIVNQGFGKFQDVSSKLNQSLSYIEDQRAFKVQNDIKAYGLNLNDQSRILPEPKQKEALKVITSLSPEQLTGLKIDKDDPNTLGLSVKSSGRDIQNKLFFNVVDATGQSKRVYVNTLVNPNAFVPSDPYGYVEQQINTQGHTSYDPKKALHTSNGRLSFVIDSDPIDGKYVSIIGPGGSPLRTDFKNPDISKIMQTMDFMSGLINPATKTYWTREDIIKALNNPDKTKEILLNAK